MTTTVTSEDVALGTVMLGRYRLVLFMARGGMGSIYLARTEGAAGFARPVIIKRALPSGDRHAIKLFAREARILARLRHPAIVSILDFAETGGEHVMVLEYVHGYTLADWTRFSRRRQRSLHLAEATWPVLRVLDALAYAHGLTDEGGQNLGIVHRDVKPSNVLIDVEGEVKLADFGIARAVDEVTETALTDVSIKGTLPFMAPELFSRATPGPVTDVYSAAVMLYTAIAGRNPFAGKDPAITIGRVLNIEPPPLHLSRDDVPEAFAKVLQRAMTRRAEARYQSAAALAEALRATYPGSPTELEASFRVGVRRDFEGSELPASLGVNSLRRRAAALSGEAIDEPRPVLDDAAEVELELDADPASDGAAQLSMATRALAAGDQLPGGPVLPARSATTGRRVGTWALAGVAVAGAIVAATQLWPRTAPPAPPEMVLVRGDVQLEADAAPAASAQADAQLAAVPTGRSPDAAAGDATLPPRPPGKDDKPPDYGKMLRRESRALGKCFEQHATEVVGTPEVAVRLHIDRSGKVSEAEILPDTLTATKLGQCLLRVASATRFGAQPKPVIVRIPLSVREK